MISKPFLKRMAILVFKKMRSYASDGRKKSCQIALMILLGSGTGYKYPVDTEPLRAGTGKNWSLSVLIYLANNGFKYAEDAVQLAHQVRSA
jgi:hypothetical protein